MTEDKWAKGFVDPSICHIQPAYPDERNTYFEGTRIYIAICGAWLGPAPIVVTPDKPLPRCEKCELKVRARPTHR